MDRSVQVAVPRNGEEWGVLEYFLQASLRTSRARLVKVYRIENPELQVQFDRRSTNLLVLPAWIDAAALAEENAVSLVCQRGFRVGIGGMPVRIGNLDIESVSSEVQPAVAGFNTSRSHARRLELVMSRVCIGRSLVVDTIDQAQSTQIPSELDSVYVSNKHRGATPAETLALPSLDFKHDYVVRDATQILPQYLVVAELISGEPELLALPLCDGCEAGAAVVWCESERAKLCEACDEELHEKTNPKITGRHVRRPIHDMPRKKGLCAECRQRDTDAYCVPCRTAVCAQCKVHHLSYNDAEADGIVRALEPEGGSHQLVPVDEVYREALHARIDDELAGPMTDALTGAKASVEAQISSVQRHKDGLQDQLADMVSGAVSHAQHLAEVRAHGLLSDEIEAARQRRTADWLTSFVQAQADELDAPDFLRAWCNYRELSESLTTADLESWSDRDTGNAKLDMKGKIGVSTVASYN